jgi:hypothetical protein
MSNDEETTLNITEASEQEVNASKPSFSSTSHLEALVCLHSDFPIYCIPLANREQIRNKGFETGDLTNWDFCGSESESKDSVTNEDSHSGSYSLKMMGGGNNYLCQTLASLVPTECIETVGCWAKNKEGQGQMYLTFWVIYDDDTSTAIILGAGWSDYNWHFVSLLLNPLVKKMIEKVKILCEGDESNYIFVDDVTVKGKTL